MSTEEVQPKKKRRKRKTTLPWSEIKDTWMVAQLEGRPMTHKQLADKFGISTFAVSSKSSSDKWADELKRRAQEKADFLANQLKSASDLAIQGVQQELATNEITVRTKHATISRALQARAMKVLTAYPLEKLTAKDALMMLRIGLEEERKALGLPDVFVRTQHDNAAHPEYKSLVQQFDGHREVQAMGIELLRRLKERKDRISDAEILSEVGLEGGINEELEADDESPPTR